MMRVSLGGKIKCVHWRVRTYNLWSRVQLPQPRFLATGLAIMQVLVPLVQSDKRPEHQQLPICYYYSEVHNWSVYRSLILVDGAN